MRSFLCFILILSTVVLSGCGQIPTGFYEEPVYFFYPRTDIDLYSSEDTLAYETREGAEFETVSALLQTYFQGPESSDLYSPFPENSVVIDTKVAGSNICITLNDKFSNALGLQLTVATSCLALTLINSLSFAGVQIDILASDGSVARSFFLSEEDIVLTDSYVALPKE